MHNKYLWAAVFWTIAVMVLCLMNSNSFSGIETFSLPGKDKYLHGVFYFILTGLWYLAFRTATDWSRKTRRIRSFMLAFSYGCLVELMQKFFTDDRSADVVDILANGAGAGLAVLILWQIEKRKKL